MNDAISNIKAELQLECILCHKEGHLKHPYTNPSFRSQNKGPRVVFKQVVESKYACPGTPARKCQNVLANGALTYRSVDADERPGVSRCLLCMPSETLYSMICSYGLLSRSEGLRGDDGELVGYAMIIAIGLLQRAINRVDVTERLLRPYAICRSRKFVFYVSRPLSTFGLDPDTGSSGVMQAKVDETSKTSKTKADELGRSSIKRPRTTLP